jgi:hypothetical protein
MVSQEARSAGIARIPGSGTAAASWLRLLRADQARQLGVSELLPGDPAEPPTQTTGKSLAILFGFIGDHPKAKQAADAARKASASASFYLFVSMLIGAFIASAAGAVGGRQRDY